MPIPSSTASQTVAGQPSVNGSQHEGPNRIFLAVKGMNAIRLHAAITNAADINGKNPAGYTPLMVAVDLGHLESVSVLIDRGASVAIESGQEHYTALMIAANSKNKANSLAVLEALIKANGSSEHIDHAGLHGETAFMLAVHARELGLARRLKEAGADVNKTNAAGYSALTYAAKEGDFSTVEWLMKESGWFSRKQVEDAMELARGLSLAAMEKALKKHPERFAVPMPEVEQVRDPVPSAPSQGMDSAMALIVANNPGPTSVRDTAASFAPESPVNKPASQERSTMDVPELAAIMRRADPAPFPVASPALQNPAHGAKESLHAAGRTDAHLAPAGPTKRPRAPVHSDDETSQARQNQNRTATTRRNDPGDAPVQVPSPLHNASGSAGFVAARQDK